MLKVVLFSVWLILTFVVLDLLLAGISAKDTLWNIASFLGIILYTYGSIKTKCLTKYTKQKRNGKRN